MTITTRKLMFSLIFWLGVSTTGCKAASGSASAGAKNDGGHTADIEAGQTKPIDAAVNNQDAGDAQTHPQCPIAEKLAVDIIDSSAKVSSSGVDYYTFELSKAQGVLIRVRSKAAPPQLALATGCGASFAAGSLLPVATVVATNAYTRGLLQPGTYTLRVQWAGSVKASTAYSFDIMRYTAVTNTACKSAAALTPSSTVAGTTFNATDKAGGCSETSAAYGKLFYSVRIPGNEGWGITATPGGSWAMTLESLETCTSTTCKERTMSSAPGKAVKLQLVNSSATPKTFLLGCSVSDADAVTGGGNFTLAATTLASCSVDAGAAACAGSDICCGSVCQAPAPGNHCGQAGATCDACPTDSSGHGVAGCNGTTCILACPTGYCLNGAGTQCVAWNSSHCGTGTCNDCTQGIASGAVASCTSAGQCTSSCPANQCVSGNACVDRDSLHCGNGACMDCTAAAPSGASVSCGNDGSCQYACPSGHCLNAATTACVAWDAQNCGTTTCADCTQGIPSGATGSCDSSGQCVTACPSGSCMAGNTCVTTDAQNCGPATGACLSCDLGAPNGATSSCTSYGTCQYDCANGCVDWTANACVPWSITHCGSSCAPCASWASNCSSSGSCQ